MITANANSGDGSPLPSTSGSQDHGIQWDGSVGVEDFYNICTKRRVWWVKLENGQAAQVADVTIVINPFPGKGESYLARHEHRLSRPGLQYEWERDAYAEAIYRAGQWAGQMIHSANVELSCEAKPDNKPTEGRK